MSSPLSKKKPVPSPDMSSKVDIPIILITGFGSFRNVLVNPSWEVAKALKWYVEWDRPVHIILHQMPVEYNSVNTKIPEYWLKYNPTLVIHLGVSPGAKEIRLEKYAHNTNYAALDNLNTIPENKCCICDAPEEICSQLPLENVCAFVKRKSSLPIAVSDDAGRYLCEFIYYQSLYIDSKRCVFIHVPCLDENKFTTEHLAETIQQVVYELLRHVEPLPVLNSNGQYGKQHNTTKIINTKPVTLKS